MVFPWGSLWLVSQRSWNVLYRWTRILVNLLTTLLSFTSDKKGGFNTENLNAGIRGTLEKEAAFLTGEKQPQESHTKIIEMHLFWIIFYLPLGSIWTCKELSFSKQSQWMGRSWYCQTSGTKMWSSKMLRSLAIKLARTKFLKKNWASSFRFFWFLMRWLLRSSC